MKVSVIVPVYNTEQYLARCLDSLVNQTLQEIEILVVDDGSSDGSLGIAKQFQDTYPGKIKLFTKENGGQSSARNLALEHATGEYLGFADSDDWVDGTMYQEMYDAAVRENADMVLCDIMEHYPDKVIRHEAQCHENWALCAPSVWDKLYRRTMVGTDRFLPGLWYEDLDFSARQFMKTEKVVAIHSVAYHCFYRQGSTMRNNNSRKNLDILAVIENLENYADQNGLREKVQRELKQLMIDHILIEAINRVERQTSAEKKDVLRQLRRSALARYPDIFRDPVFRQQPRNRQVVARLNGAGLSVVSKWMVQFKQRLH